jgi:hypothetical protein
MKSIFNQPIGKWPNELIKVVWNHNTVVSRCTGFTPFKLLFSDESITPEEARRGSIRTLALAEDEDSCKTEKDTIEGTRLQAIEHINKYQAETIKWHDRKVKLKNIKQANWCFVGWPTLIQWGSFSSSGKAPFWWYLRQDLVLKD